MHAAAELTSNAAKLAKQLIFLNPTLLIEEELSHSLQDL